MAADAITPSARVEAAALVVPPARLAERERIERQALVVALGRRAPAGMEPAGLAAAGLATLVEALAGDRGIALEREPSRAGAPCCEAAIGMGPLAGHGEPASEAQRLLLDHPPPAGRCCCAATSWPSSRSRPGWARCWP